MKDNENPSNPRMHNPDGMYASEARNEDYFSLRDYFAAKAMQGLLSNPNYVVSLMGNSNLPVPDYLSTISFEIADSMLKERTK